MKIWSVIIKDEAEDGHSNESYWGEAENYVQAGDAAIGLAFIDGFKRPWVDSVSCFGEKRF